MNIRPLRPAWLALIAASLAPSAGLADDRPLPVDNVMKDFGTTSFLREVAPILVRNCIACHNTRKVEGKYVMTTFAQLAKGGAAGEGAMLEPGDPDASYFVELCRPDATPRMPYKLDPLSASDLATIERWVKDGARYDGASPLEDWSVALRRINPPTVPEAYPAPVPITALAFDASGTEVWASGYHELTRWKAADGSSDLRVKRLAERTYAIGTSPDGRWLAAASGDPGQYGQVRLWALDSLGNPDPATLRQFPESVDCALAVAFSPDGSKLAAAGADRTIRVWDVLTAREILTIEDHADWIFDLAWSPDGRRIATASRDKTAKVFDVEKREALVTFPGHNEPVYCVRFVNDGKSVATGGGDGQVRVWSADDDGKQTGSLGGWGGPVFRLALAADGKTLAAAGADHSVRVFENLNQKHKLDGHADWVYSLAFSPDGKALASGAWDGEVRLWSTLDGKPIRRFVAAPGLRSPGGPTP